MEKNTKKRRKKGLREFLTGWQEDNFPFTSYNQFNGTIILLFWQLTSRNSVNSIYYTKCSFFSSKETFFSNNIQYYSCLVIFSSSSSQYQWNSRLYNNL